MYTRRCFTTRPATIAIPFLAALSLVACNQSQRPVTSTAETKVPPTKEVYVIFQGPWVFAADPKDVNSVIALAPKTQSHRDLVVQTGDKTLPAGVYSLSLPPRSGAAAGEVDPNILRAKIDPQDVQHVLDTKSERYAIRLPKPEAYVEATHYRSRGGSSYPPDVSTEKDYVTSVSLRYIVSNLNGFSLAGSPDTGTFSPLPLRVATPTLSFIIEPAHDPSAAEKCHAHERQAFRDLTKLVNVTLFLDFPGDDSTCQAKDPQNPHPIKADIIPASGSFFARHSAGGRKQDFLALILFFGGIHDCMAPVIVGAS